MQGRNLLAFLIAPLCVPVVLGIFYTMFIFPQSPAWVIIMTTVMLMFSYASMGILGVPVFVLFRRYRMTNLWIAIAAGFICGSIGFFGFWILIGILLDESFSLVFSTLIGSFKRQDILWVAVSGVLGPPSVLYSGS